MLKMARRVSVREKVPTRIALTKLFLLLLLEKGQCNVYKKSAGVQKRIDEKVNQFSLFFFLFFST